MKTCTSCTSHAYRDQPIRKTSYLHDKTNTSKLFLYDFRSILSKWPAERQHFPAKDLSVQIPIQNLHIHFQVRLLNIYYCKEILRKRKKQDFLRSLTCMNMSLHYTVCQVIIAAERQRGSTLFSTHVVFVTRPCAPSLVVLWLESRHFVELYVRIQGGYGN